MALSGREVFLILRARDEASRTLRRVSSTMSRMDRDAASASRAVITQQQTALTQMTRKVGDVQYAYSAAATEAKRLHDVRMNDISGQMVTLRRRQDDVTRAYQFSMQRAQEMGAADRKNAVAARKIAMDARRERATQMSQIQQEKYALEDASRASHRMYQTQMTDIRATRIAQKEQLRQEAMAAQDSIAMHKQRIQQIQDEIEARKESGRALMNNGTMAVTLGATMIGLGAVGARAIAGMVSQTVAWDKATRNTYTQVDIAGAKLKDLDRIGKEVGATVPVSLEQIQPALYDIFSSIDTNLEGGRKLLKQFAKDSVGGQTDMATATRANIGIMNAYHVSVKDAAKVSDFMFRLVQKGVGTYTQFANVIGRAVPSARRAGQSYQTLGAMMVLLTRNGMSAAMAATSSARALDAISNSKTAEKLNKIGIATKNARGEFRPLPAILDDMNKKFGKMTAPDRAKALQELFKGSGGTIQARRFFDTYFKNAKQFNKYNRDMYNSTGQAQKAFEKLNRSPAAQLQNLKNQWQLLQIQMGKFLIPLLTQLAKGISHVLTWFNNLPAPVKKSTAVIALVSTALLLVLGTITTFAGAAMIFVGATRMMGIGAATAAGRISGLTAGLTMLVAGMAMAHKSTNDTTQAVGVLTTVAGGAAAGSIFGPWGTVAGAAAGGVLGLVAAFKKSSDTITEAKAPVADYGATLDTLTGKITKATRAMVSQSLQTAGAFTEANKLKISTRDVVSAAMGHKDAIDRVTNSMRKQVAANPSLLAATLNLSQALGLVGDDYTKQVAKAREASGAAQTWAQALKGVPKKVQTKLQMENYEPSKKQLREIKRMTTPAEYKIVLKALNIGPVQKQLKRTQQNFDDVVNGLDRAGDKGGHSFLDGIQAAIRKARINLQPLASGIQTGMAKPKRTAAVGGAQVGNNLKQGIIQGFAGTEAILSAQASSAVNGAVAAAKRAGDIHSPSRKTQYIGKMIMEGLVKGIRDEMPTLDKLMTAVGKALTKDFTKQMKARVRRQTAGPLKQLQDVAKQIQAVHKKLEDAQSKLDDIKQERQSYVDNVTSSIQSFGSLSQMSSTQDVFGNDIAPTPSNIIAFYQKQLGFVKGYSDNLKKLVAMGFSKNVYDQVIQMGPELGSQYAAALIQATPDQVSQINSLSGSIQTVSNQIGQAAGDEMYAAGIAAAQGLVNGLKSQEDALVAEATHLANLITKAVKKALKIKSPSKVALGIGDNFGSSLATALAGHTGTVRQASTQLAKAAIFDPSVNQYMARPVVGASPGSPVGGQGGTVNHFDQKFEITTQEIDPRKHAADLGFEIVGRLGS